MQGTDQDKMADLVINKGIAWVQNRRMVVAELKRLYQGAKHCVDMHQNVENVGLATVLLGDLVAGTGLASLLLLSWRPACYLIPIGTIMSLIGTLMIDYSKKEARDEIIYKIGRHALQEHQIDNNHLVEALDSLRHFRSHTPGPLLGDLSRLLILEGHIIAANRDTTFKTWKRYTEDYMNQLKDETTPVSVYLKLVCTAIVLVTCGGVGWYQHAGLVSKGVMILFVGAMIPMDVLDRMFMPPKDKYIAIQSHISQAIENLEKHQPTEGALLGEDEGYEDI